MKKEEQMNLPETLPLSSTLSNTGLQVWHNEQRRTGEPTWDLTLSSTLSDTGLQVWHNEQRRTGEPTWDFPLVFHTQWLQLLLCSILTGAENTPPCQLKHKLSFLSAKAQTFLVISESTNFPCCQLKHKLSLSVKLKIQTFLVVS